MKFSIIQKGATMTTKNIFKEFFIKEEDFNDDNETKEGRENG